MWFDDRGKCEDPRKSPHATETRHRNIDISSVGAALKILRLLNRMNKTRAVRHLGCARLLYIFSFSIGRLFWQLGAMVPSNPSARTNHYQGGRFPLLFKGTTLWAPQTRKAAPGKQQRCHSRGIVPFFTAWTKQKPGLQVSRGTNMAGYRAPKQKLVVPLIIIIFKFISHSKRKSTTW